MKKGFSIQDYLEKNKIELGSIKKEVGSSVYKGGHNDLRKTSYDVNIKDGKFQLDTHKTVITENGKLSRIINSNINEGITLSKDEKRDIEKIIEKDIAPFMRMIAKTNGTEYFNEVKKEFISVFNKIKP